MYGDTEQAAAAAERTAFRRAEKQYKLYKPLKPKGGRARSKPGGGGGGGGGLEDLSAVVDFHALLAAGGGGGGELPGGIGRRDVAGFDRPVFCFLDRPGFYFIPGALSIEEQCYWIRESLKTFPQPPNRTNLTALYGPIFDLLTAAKSGKILVEVGNPNDQERSEQNSDGRKSNSFKFLEDTEIQKGERNYDVSLPHNKIPDLLSVLAKKMAIPAMPSGEEFKPEAAIVNYYGPSDMLGGHVDDMEADWSKPIVSISLGCKCIFLLGGKTRDEVPTAMFLRSGDIVLMAGEARECFHGVPRIFTGSDQAEISALVPQLSAEDDSFILNYIQNSRININIRQVY
uniref:Fe2OG dioxygenase domain-containing protein n=1 Tax=Oryza glumipatula TaxID=40148 RepID=A0A0E0BJ53_9ORYZ